MNASNTGTTSTTQDCALDLEIITDTARVEVDKILNKEEVLDVLLAKSEDLKNSVGVFKKTPHKTTLASHCTRTRVLIGTVVLMVALVLLILVILFATNVIPT